MLQNQIDDKRAIGVKLCERLRAEITKLGFANDELLDHPYYHTASFVLIKDPYWGTVRIPA